MLLFPRLCLAHVIGEAVARRSPRWFTPATHCVLGFVAILPRVAWRLAWLVVGLTAARWAVDWLGLHLTRKEWVRFVVGQCAKALLIAIIGLRLAFGAWSKSLDAVVRVLQVPKFYVYAITYIVVVFAGDLMIQQVCQAFSWGRKNAHGTAKYGLENAGRYIGWMERRLILTAVIGGYGQAVGFVIAAKALARYPHIEKDGSGESADYFLIGTLTSISLALLGGLALLKSRRYL